MKRKLVALALTALLCFGAAAGCERQAEQDTAPPVQTATASPSPAMPSATADVTPDGVTVSAELATADVLGRYAELNEFLEFNEPGYPKIVIAVSETVTDFKWLEVIVQDNGSGTAVYETVELYALDELTAEKPFLVTWLEQGMLPHRGISFTDLSGAVSYFYVTLDTTGELDNPIRLVEFEPFEGVLTQTKDIPITREGETETFTAALSVSSGRYAIYVLPDFELVTGATHDVVRPREDSALSDKINMRIYKVSGDSVKPADAVIAGTATRYERVQLDGETFEIELNYPVEAAEGGAVLLQAMLESIVGWSLAVVRCT
ncbi:MAG: hypothetical protein LBC65_06380 [Oscillospiraceae bacterium]|jgi:hypothetical protein|nr:hypothetical protein [Oscillospiraceae bacterium]